MFPPSALCCAYWKGENNQPPTHTRHKCKGKLDRRHPCCCYVISSRGVFSCYTSIFYADEYVEGTTSSLRVRVVVVDVVIGNVNLFDLKDRRCHQSWLTFYPSKATDIVFFQFPLIKEHTSYRVFVILGVSVLLLLPCHTPNGNEEDLWQSRNRLSELDLKHFTKKTI